MPDEAVEAGRSARPVPKVPVPPVRKGKHWTWFEPAGEGDSFRWRETTGDEGEAPADNAFERDAGRRGGFFFSKGGIGAPNSPPGWKEEKKARKRAEKERARETRETHKAWEKYSQKVEKEEGRRKAAAVKEQEEVAKATRKAYQDAMWAMAYGVPEDPKNPPPTIPANYAAPPRKFGGYFSSGSSKKPSASIPAGSSVPYAIKYRASVTPATPSAPQLYTIDAVTQSRVFPGMSRTAAYAVQMLESEEAKARAAKGAWKSSSWT